MPYSQSRYLTVLQLLFSLLAVLLSSACHGMEKTESSERPNIVFILVDDLGWQDIGYQGAEIRTPNLDALAAEGVRLDRNYVYPICSPTRAALMTGRSPLGFGIDGPMENDAMLPLDVKLLPEFMRDAGYDTWMVGKWHLGMSNVAAAPHSRGFNYFYGHLGGFIDYYTHVYFGGLDWQRNGTSVREDGHATDLLTQDAARLIGSYNGDKPFFMFLSLNAPHTPLQYPPSPQYKYSDIESADRQVLAQMTTHLDLAVGQIVAALGERGVLDNTMIVFMSDNGGNLEAGSDNGPLRGSKGDALEGGVRVPAFISWPLGLHGKRTFTQPIFVQDWLPTLLEASGEDVEGLDVDGESVWAELVAGTSRPERTVVVGTRRSKAVYEFPWKLLRHGSKGEGTADSVSQDRLFNVENDPGETTDLSSEHPDIVRMLAVELDRLPEQASKGAKGPPPESLFRNSEGQFVYDIRMPETRAPWAESAVGR